MNPSPGWPLRRRWRIAKLGDMQHIKAVPQSDFAETQNMSIDRHLLEILVCPVTKVPVKPLSKDRLAILNGEVEKGNVCYQDGQQVAGDLMEALITEDGRTIYPVEDGIPVMLEDHGIAASQVPGW